MKKIRRAPNAPIDLDKIAREHWAIIVPILVSEGIVSEIDLPILSMACSCYSEYKKNENYEDRVSPMKDYINIMKLFGATSMCAQKITTNSMQTPRRRQNTEDRELVKAFE